MTHWCFRCCWAEPTLNQGLFSPGRDRRAQEAVREHSQSQDSWSQLDKGISWTIWCHTQHINPGNWLGVAGHSSGLAAHWSAGDEQLIAHPSFCIFFFIMIIFCSTELPLSQSLGVTFFPFSPHPSCVCEWANGCLNHHKNKTPLPFFIWTERLLQVENQKQKYGIALTPFGGIRSVPFAC